MTLLPNIPQAMTNSVPLLENGDRMKQPEFHRRYEQYPDPVKSERIRWSNP
jgi:hypothetical protein